VRVEQVNGAEAEPPAERPRFEELTAVWAEPAAGGGLPQGGRVAVTGADRSARLRKLAEGLPRESLTIILAGALPEDVTEWRRSFEGVPLAGGAFDRPLDEQAQAAEVAVELAKRVAERGEHAVVVVDSLDALPGAAARRVFGAGRKTEEAGTLTVIAAVESPELARLATAFVEG
jgi:transcription termination factor Rho